MQMKNHTHIHRVYIITGNWRAIYECGYVCDNQENFLFHLILVLNQNFPQIYPFSSTICTTSISQNTYDECTQVRAHTHKYSYGGQDFTMLQKKGTKLIKAGLKTFNSHCQLCFCDSSVDVVICFEMSPCVVLCVTRKMLFETLSWMKFMDSARRTPYHPVGKIRMWQKRRKKTDEKRKKVGFRTCTFLYTTSVELFCPDCVQILRW